VYTVFPFHHWTIRGVKASDVYKSSVARLLAGARSHESRENQRAYRDHFFFEEGLIVLRAVKKRHRSRKEATVDQIKLHSSRRDNGEEAVRAVYDRYREQWFESLGVSPWTIEEMTGTTYYWDWSASLISAAIRYEEVGSRPYSVDLSLSST